jgi:dihydropteroate synthase
MFIGGKEFDFKNKTYIMGILNFTPDSFSDGSKFNTIKNAVDQAAKMVGEGADIIDIGGMSTKPNHDIISTDEEISRVLPVLEEVKKRFDIPVSVDTYRAVVADAAVGAGAALINDVWGANHPEEPRMADVIVKHNIPCCLMHNNPVNVHAIEEVMTGLRRILDNAEAKGINKESIILDPGLGFAKDPVMNLRVVKNIGRFNEFGLPVLLGASRKSMIGRALDLPVTDRLEGTMAVTAYAMTKTHIAVVRVHDVKENLRVLKMIKAIESVEN